MIRIDLGKTELRRAKGGEQIKTRLESLLAGNPKAKSALAKVSADVGTIVMIAAALALSFLPHLVFEEYRKMLKRQIDEQTVELETKIRETEAEIARLLPYQKELESYEVQKRQVQQRLGVIQKLLAERATPVNVLDAVSQSLPGQVWLQGLELKAKDRVISLRGQALTNEGISDYVDKLSESIYLEEVRLQDVVTQAGAVNTTRSFSVVARTKPLPPVLTPAALPGSSAASGSATGAPR